jgi:hypothetical protein
MSGLIIKCDVFILFELQKYCLDYYLVETHFEYVLLRDTLAGIKCIFYSQIDCF